MASGTISIADGYTAQLGQPLLFAYTTDGLHGNQKPRIQIMAYQDVDGDGNANDLVYGEARDADPVAGGVNRQPFDPLGGGSSLWLQRGGPAHCVATLYYWDWHPVQTFVPLAEPIEFDAAG